MQLIVKTKIYINMNKSGCLMQRDCMQPNSHESHAAVCNIRLTDNMRFCLGVANIHTLSSKQSNRSITSDDF
jgi:hypothetical protein